MLRTPRRLLLGPLLAVCASGAVLVVDPAAASAATSATVSVRGTLTVRAAATSASAKMGCVEEQGEDLHRLPGQRPVRQGQRAQDRPMGPADQRHVRVPRVREDQQVHPGLPATAGAARAEPGRDGPLTTVSNAAFLAAAIGPAQASQREFKVPASVTLAQAILESGWGRSKLSAQRQELLRHEVLRRTRARSRSAATTT